MEDEMAYTLEGVNDAPAGITIWPRIDNTMGKCDRCLNFEMRLSACKANQKSPATCGPHYQPMVQDGQINAGDRVKPAAVSAPEVQETPLNTDAVKTSLQDGYHQSELVNQIRQIVSAGKATMATWQPVLRKARELGIAVGKPTLLASGLTEQDIAKLRFNWTADCLTESENLLQKSEQAGNPIWERVGGPVRYRYCYIKDGVRYFSNDDIHPAMIKSGYPKNGPKLRMVAVRRTEAGVPISEELQNRIFAETKRIADATDLPGERDSESVTIHKMMAKSAACAQVAWHAWYIGEDAYRQAMREADQHATALGKMTGGSLFKAMHPKFDGHFDTDFHALMDMAGRIGDYSNTELVSSYYHPAEIADRQRRQADLAKSSDYTDEDRSAIDMMIKGVVDRTVLVSPKGRSAEAVADVIWNHVQKAQKTYPKMAKAMNALGYDKTFITESVRTKMKG